MVQTSSSYEYWLCLNMIIAIHLAYVCKIDHDQINLTSFYAKMLSLSLRRLSLCIEEIVVSIQLWNVVMDFYNHVLSDSTRNSQNLATTGCLFQTKNSSTMIASFYKRTTHFRRKCVSDLFLKFIIFFPWSWRVSTLVLLIVKKKVASY